MTQPTINQSKVRHPVFPIYISCVLCIIFSFFQAFKDTIVWLNKVQKDELDLTIKVNLDFKFFQINSKLDLCKILFFFVENKISENK